MAAVVPGNFNEMRAFSQQAVLRLLGIAALGLAFLSGCDPAPKVGPARPAGGPTSATFTGISQDILVPRCASSACHSGTPPAYEPSLDADLAYDAIVGVQATQAPAVLVVPGEPSQSYLVQKLRGEGGNSGGIATLMPPGDPLDPSEIEAIEAWIVNGAPND
jgi:hypothetical protein